MANSANVYIKCERNVELQSPDAFLKDIASVRCADSSINAKVKALKVHHFGKEESKRCVISALELVELVENECPGVNVQILGETDVLLEWVNADAHKGAVQWGKALLVCLVSFFGTAFTIMAYHNDVGINEVFQEIYRMVMNQEPQKLNVLEISYSIGLAAGIVVFFNHVGRRRITKDPTPIEVAMRKYEQDVDMTVIENAEREGK